MRFALTSPTFAFHQQFLPVGADEGFREERRKIHHDFPQKRANGSQCHFEFLRERRLAGWRRNWKMIDQPLDR